MREYYIPTKEEIKSFKIGDLAPNVFGKWNKITSIHAMQQDINGKWFICYYTEFNDNGSKMSGSLKEGEMLRDCTNIGNFNSWELDEIENHLLGNGIKYPLAKMSDKLQQELKRLGF